MGYYRLDMTITLDGKDIKVKEITQENYNLATSKESIAMSKSLGGTDTFIKAGLRSTSPDGTKTTVFIANPSLAPKYMREAIKAYEESKEAGE